MNTNRRMHSTIFAGKVYSCHGTCQVDANGHDFLDPSVDRSLYYGIRVCIPVHVQMAVGVDQIGGVTQDRTLDGLSFTGHSFGTFQ
jgi:hypothetical protein